ncbi:MAG: hypothetical protein E7344_03435 [Clostridiales bacterium]|nr:hypothetical protein [Clostridiales bacterium]
MQNFWDFSVWGLFNIFAILLLSLLVANALKKKISFIQKSLIPTSVLAGVILLIISTIFFFTTDGQVIYDTEFFGGNGSAVLEIITYHCLALGFIASSLKTSNNKFTKKRSAEIFDSGVTTVSTYLLQAVLGFGITLVAVNMVEGLISAAGVLLPFGYGQGTGQAMNYGNIYEQDWGFVGGKNFGLTIAALGFLSASIGGVIHLNVMRRKGKIVFANDKYIPVDKVESENEVEMSGSIDKLTIQVALIAIAYIIAYGMMCGLGALLPGMKSTIFGFNFLLGVIGALLVKQTLKLLKKGGLVKKDYTNNFLLTRVSNFCFDLMVVAGVAVIRLDLLKDYWGILLILGVVGLVSTYVYNLFVAKKLFADYADEQFLAMYGMLTGTASTGAILLREIDGEFKTPASDNLIYQTVPAIAFGFPMMLLATLAPAQPMLTFGLLIAFFIVMNVILFRRQIFKHKNK